MTMRLTGYLLVAALLLLLAACGGGPSTQGESKPPGEYGFSEIEAYCLDEARDDAPAGVRLTWTASEAAEGYRLLRDSEVVAELAASTREHDDASDLEAGSMVSYVLRAYNSAGVRDAIAEPYTVPLDVCPDSDEVEPEDPVNPEDPEIPEDPENPADPEDPENPEEPEDPEEPENPEEPGPGVELQVTATCNPLPHSELTWSAVPEATGYTLYRNGQVLEVLSDSVNSFTDEQMLIEVDYEYVLQVQLAESIAESEAVTAYIPFTDCELRSNPVATFGDSNLAIDRYGGVWAWGRFAAPGIGRVHVAQQQIVGLQDTVAVLGHDTHAVALDSNGQVRFKPGWDAEVLDSDDLHLDATEFMDAVTGLPLIRDIAIGTSHVLALSVNGTVYAWGRNQFGQTGQIPVEAGFQEPMQISGLDRIVRVFAGEDRSMAVRADGRLLAWGNNEDGRLGVDTVEGEVHQPVLVEGIDGAVSEVHMNSPVTLILTDSGDVYGVGANWRLGIGPDFGTTLEPLLLPGMGEVMTLSVGTEHALAVLADGTVIGWGRNAQSQLGSGPTNESYPVTVYDDVPAVQVAAGRAHSLIMDSSGKLHALGDNREFQLGFTSESRYDYFLDNNFAFPADILELAAGHSFALALLEDGSLWAWGLDSSDRLGTGGQPATSLPSQVLVDAGGDFIAVAAGYDHVLALDDQGQVWSWGSNFYGQLGRDDTSGDEPGSIGGLADVQAIAAGDRFSLALDNSGKVYAWGQNHDGQLGVGDTDARTVPTPIDFDLLIEVTAIAAGSQHAALVTAGGEVYSWGDRSGGAMGTIGGSSAGDEPTPVKSNTTPDVVDIAAGDGHSVALHEDGTVSAWGSGSNGIGVGNLPARVSDLNNIVALDSSPSSVLAMSSTGTVFGWGRASSGQFGFESAEPTISVPVALPLVAAGAMIEAGTGYSLVVAVDGRLMVAGDDSDGQLGLGTRRYHSNTPVQVLMLPPVGPN